MRTNTNLAAIGNAILIFVTFLLAIPGIIMPTSRGWLKIHGAMVVVCGIFTLVIGLDIWFETLKTRENLGLLWNQQSNDVQSLLQREVRPEFPSCFSFALPNVSQMKDLYPEKEMKYNSKNHVDNTNS